VANPRKLAEIHTERFIEYLKRVLLHAVLSLHTRANPVLRLILSLGALEQAASAHGSQIAVRLANDRSLFACAVLRKLFHEVADPGQLEALNLNGVLDWTQSALNRIDRASFFQKFQEDHAVQYFYEPFLQAYDPELRKDLGVWYTPTEIVQYMVARWTV
jgi:Type I restriction-modification system methyltransferase subunit